MTANQAIKDVNSVATLVGVSNVDYVTPVTVAVDPVTHRVLTNTVISGITSINGDTTAAQIIAGGTGISVATVAGTTTITNTGGVGTVTTVSVVSANGLAGTVANATTTPAITLTTSITGILKGNGTAISAATADTDYSTPTGMETFTNKTYDTAGTGNVLKINGTQVSAVTGTGSVVLATSPTLTTPTLGVATATSVNKVTITAPATGSTLTIPDGVTLTGPASSGTAMTLGNAETVTGAKTFQKIINTVTAMAAQALDGSTANIFTRTLAASETFTQSNFTTGQCFMVEVKQGSGTTYTVTWFSGITWITSGGTAPVQTTTSNGYTSYGFRCTGSNTFEGYLVGTN